jgi:hypothetical protein
LARAREIVEAEKIYGDQHGNKNLDREDLLAALDTDLAGLRRLVIRWRGMANDHEARCGAYLLESCAEELADELAAFESSAPAGAGQVEDRATDNQLEILARGDDGGA